MTNPNPYTIRDGVARIVNGVIVGGDVVAEAPDLDGANAALRTLAAEGYTELRGPSYEPDREQDVPDVDVAPEIDLDALRWQERERQYIDAYPYGGN